MQLPRGTFHSIKKHVTIRSLLDEASAMRFTGTIIVSFRDGVASLVLESGQTVLAAYQDVHGKTAFERMGQLGEQPLDAELTLLNESQLGLAKEFNPSCKTHLESSAAVLFGKKEPSREIPPVQKTIITAANRTQIRARAPAAKETPLRTFKDGEVENLLEGDLDALDRMDLAKMSGKFRTNAQSIARELNLDHLGET